jgi:hypothetical protein
MISAHNAQNPTRNFQKYTKSHEELPNMHKIPWGSSKMHKIPRRTSKNIPRGTSSNAQNLIRNFQNSHNPMRNFQRCKKSYWDFLSAFLKVPNGMSYILEVPHIIFGNFGSFSSDFVHFWKLLLGCCVFMEVSHGNCCILEDSYGYCAI